ncbi:outer membrane porin, OprD family [Acinetobacter sp. B5B]|uniref:OprD family outer membrane porin n=1 Tax=Acinetobacter baretiae TaxID=2605383 RepID=UPI0018C2780B|nr:OprD family outer membrane porin [Acinetobacter baretiae]MBF7681767.1 outer membrane porin, OprD family [Acinetobacter baretiae]
MPKIHKKLTLALVVNAALLSTTLHASEQSEAKGFVEEAKGSVLFRNGWIYRDRTDGRQDTNSWGQTAIVKLDSGYTQGLVGVGVGVLGDFSFKIGQNNKAGNQMLNMIDGKSGRDQWTRGGANVKARISNTTVVYGTQYLQLPVLASSDYRLTPEYFTGTLVTSREIKNLELTYGHFTKDQDVNQISSDGNHLKRADVWGASYKFTDALSGSYFGSKLKDALERHYLNVNYKMALDNNASLTLDASGYHTKYDASLNSPDPSKRILSYPTGSAGTEKKNNLWATSATYNQGPHTAMLTYEQSTGNVGYDYGIVGDGGATLAVPNSFFSDYNGNSEKSMQALYSVDFGEFGVPGLSWTTAFLYGWNIKVDGQTSKGKEHELFNQIKYTVQSGFAKNLSFKLRNSTYRTNDAYKSYAGDTSDWRGFIEYTLNF